MTTTQTKHRILVTLEGGVIQSITNIPADAVVEVRDYDRNGDQNHPTWSEEYQAFVSIWKSEQASLPGGMAFTATLDANGTEDELTIRDRQGQPMAAIQFWDTGEGSRNRAHADARAIVDALNAAHRNPGEPR